jgi:hypothetical protein
MDSVLAQIVTVIPLLASNLPMVLPQVLAPIIETFGILVIVAN